jgi:hypothetical protein
VPSGTGYFQLLVLLQFVARYVLNVRKRLAVLLSVLAERSDRSANAAVGVAHLAVMSPIRLNADSTSSARSSPPGGTRLAMSLSWPRSKSFPELTSTFEFVVERVQRR